MSHIPASGRRALALLATVALAACGGGDGPEPQRPSILAKTAGDAVTGTVGTATPAAPTVKVTDASGNVFANVVVNFAVTAGGGGIARAVDTTDASGLASAGTWTLGGAAGVQTVTATSPTVPGASAVFSATAAVGPAARLAIVSQPAGPLAAGQTFAQPIVVEVQDAFGNRTASTATVSLAVLGTGNPSLTGTTTLNAVAGRATFTDIGMTRAGTGFTFLASAPGLTFATGAAFTVLAGPVAVLEKLHGDVQVGGASAPAFIPVAIRAVDALGNPIPAAPVTFTVTAGGGTIATTGTTTDALGTATPGRWTLGPAAGANVVRASIGGLVADFTATAAAPAPHQVTLRFINVPNRVQQEAFERAWQRWRDIVRSELADLDFASAPVTNPCGASTPFVLNEVVDDLLILVNLRPIDGPGEVLGSAGPCRVRVNPTTGAVLQTVVGVMTFDTADIEALAAQGRLDAVVLHEMGHVLGIGSLWQATNLSVGAGTDTVNYVGAAGRTAYQALGAAAGSTVPVENCVGLTNCGAGNRDAHWRELTFRTELMTGFLNSGAPNPLSSLSIASLVDLGYAVDASRADPYVLPASISALGASGGAVGTAGLFELREARLEAEPVAVDRQGRSVGTVEEFRRRYPQRPAP